VTAQQYGWYWALAAAQGALVVVPRRPPPLAVFGVLRRRWPLVIAPVAALVALAFAPPVASRLAGGLSTLALVAVPLLALAAAAWLTRMPALAVVLVAALVGLAWWRPHETGGEVAALVLVALSGVATAMLVVAVMPAPAVEIGIVIWAAVDFSVALSHHLDEASAPIVSAKPVVHAAARLQLQRVVLGSASMEWADLFLAAVLGAVLAVDGRRRGVTALLVVLFGVVSATFFLVTDTLPATVPIALALLLTHALGLGARAARPR
jgi:hypothetical protein